MIAPFRHCARDLVSQPADHKNISYGRTIGQRLVEGALHRCGRTAARTSIRCHDRPGIAIPQPNAERFRAEARKEWQHDAADFQNGKE